MSRDATARGDSSAHLAFGLGLGSLLLRQARHKRDRHGHALGVVELQLPGRGSATRVARHCLRDGQRILEFHLLSGLEVARSHARAGGLAGRLHGGRDGQNQRQGDHGDASEHTHDAQHQQRNVAQRGARAHPVAALRERHVVAVGQMILAQCQRGEKQ